MSQYHIFPNTVPISSQVGRIKLKRLKCMKNLNTKIMQITLQVTRNNIKLRKERNCKIKNKFS